MKKVLPLLFLFFSFLHSGDRGKIIGTVKDANTNESLVGVNILIVGTTLGAVSDENGFFIINNISPNFYTLKFTLIGYKTVEVKNLRVAADLTTEKNIELSPTTIEFSEPVTIFAERELIQKDRTSTQIVLDGNVASKDLRLTSISEILTLQSGVSKSPDGSLHIRGGRSGGITYQIDGITTVNPFSRTFSGIMEIDRVEEFQTHLGTFDAEFGNASDGVVSLISKDGTDDFKFKFKFETTQLNSSPYHKKDWNLDRSEIKNLENKNDYLDEVRNTDGTSSYEFVSMLDDEFAKKYLIVPVLANFSTSISGPLVIPSLNFFATTRFINEDSQLPFGYEMLRSFTTKFTYQISSSLSLRVGYDWSQNFSQDYNHQYKYWRWFNSGLDQFGRSGSFEIKKEFSNRQMIQLRQVLNKNSFYDLTFSRIFQSNVIEVPNRTIFFDNTTGELISSDYLKRLYVGGIDGSFRYGDVRYFTKIKSTQFIAKGNFENQFNQHNQFRSGFEIKNHEIFRHRIGMPPLENLQFFTEQPIELSFYAQDKLEFNFMILKIGLRFDYFDVKKEAYQNLANILKVISLSDGTTSYTTNEKEKVKPHLQISPRIGLAHPINEKTSIHFAYGHFFQIPTFYDLYRNDDLNSILVNDALIGNPALKPEKTVSYELGIQHQISEFWGMNLTAYSKDISNLTSSFYYFVGRDYTIFTNQDFGRVQGLDLSLEKKFSDYFNLKMNYTLTHAMGNESDPTEGYNSYREDQAHLRPNRNFYLDFDQRHKINFILNSKFPKEFGFLFFGIYPIEQFSNVVIFSAGSGLPYTPTSREAEESNIVPEPNSARKPWTYNLDLKTSIELKMFENLFTIYCDITNLFDTENVLYVWTRSGEALSQGPSSIYSKDFQSNPEYLAPRRAVRLGLILEF